MISPISVDSAKMRVRGSDKSHSNRASILEIILHKLKWSLAVSALVASLSLAACAEDVVAPVRQFIDGFNKGDSKTAFAAYAHGDILIVDEFAPHRWYGPHAPQDWAAAYDNHAQATGVTEGIVQYSKPTRMEIEGDAAYVILPTVYLYKEHGKPIAEEGQVTCVLKREAAGWKISAWTWSGVKPHPAK